MVYNAYKSDGKTSHTFTAASILSWQIEIEGSTACRSLFAPVKGEELSSADFTAPKPQRAGSIPKGLNVEAPSELSSVFKGSVLPSILILSLLGFVESISVGSVFAVRNGYVRISGSAWQNLLFTCL